jgi:ABC-type multidrug transport system fused ATPase/permease subunit
MNIEEKESLFQELQQIKENYVDSRRNWYKKHRNYPLIAFRSAGIGVIILSLSIPLLALFENSPKVILSIFAYAVAAITTLNTFFSWQGMWEKRVRLWHSLQGLVAEWEVKMANARRKTKLKVACLEAKNATLFLIENTRELDVGETKVLMEKIKFPNGLGVK